MCEMRVLLETSEPVNGDLRSAWFTLPISNEEISDILGIDAFNENYRVLEADAPFADEITEDMTDIQLNDFYAAFCELPDVMQEEYAELSCCFNGLEELHRLRHSVIHYEDCHCMADVARRVLVENPAFSSMSEDCLRYFDFEGYGEYLENNGTFLHTDHGIFEIP